MELTTSHAIQGLMVLATIAGGYAVVKSNLSRVMEDLEEHIKRFEDHRNKFDARLDDAESERSVFQAQIGTLKDINSVDALERHNREMGDLQARLKMAEENIGKLQSMHNGRHK